MYLCVFVVTFLLANVSAELPIKLRTERVITSGLANIHVDSIGTIDGSIRYTFGSCSDHAPSEDHQTIAISAERDHDRLIWKVPSATHSTGCVSAWDSGSNLVGRSDPVTLAKINKRTVVPMDNSSHIDAEGPWFDGVVQLSGTSATVDSAAAKSKEIAIVGAGMGGLMTWLCLHQAGMKNIRIIEASKRFGGRIRTEYFGDPSERVYQEMGPMRFPKSITDAKTNTTLQIQDHKLVFDLAAEVNRLNGNDPKLAVNFIKWLQHSQGGLQCAGGVRKPDGRCPTVADIARNSSLTQPKPQLDTEGQSLADKISKLVIDPETISSLAKNVFEAHKTWLDTGLGGIGGDKWSEFAYMHNYLKYSLNATDAVLNTVLEGGPSDGSFWGTLYEVEYFEATDWATIDGGLNRLPQAFHPLVDNITSFNSRVSKISYDEDTKKVSVFWRPGTSTDYSEELQSSSHDYVITAVPFALMRLWDLPEFSLTKSDAIQTYGYDAVCKIALKFKTRFWEHFDEPIIGGCDTTTDTPGIGSICYPSYDINSTGPGALLASYTSPDSGLRWPAVPEKAHVKYVVDAMADIHGDVVYEQYTGEYKRQCWLLDEFETISWGAATIGQRQLYIPEFFKTEKGVILSGESTAYTSAWIASALEAAVRGSVQLLLELGLVDEAKSTAEKWMARWISL